MRGADYAAGWKPGFGKSLKAAGYGFVMRYLGGSPSKDITKAEAADLLGAGVSIGLVYESTANRMLGGRTAGVADAIAAKAQAAAVGAPASVSIYFAADFDVQPSQMAACMAYMDGAASVLTAPRTGIYGGYAVVNAAKGHNKAFRLWQTFAWSGGKVLFGLDLYQGHQSTVAGVTVDTNTSYTDAGLWSKGGSDMTKAETQKLIDDTLAAVTGGRVFEFAAGAFDHENGATKPATNTPSRKLGFDFAAKVAAAGGTLPKELKLLGGVLELAP